MMAETPSAIFLAMTNDLLVGNDGSPIPTRDLNSTVDAPAQQTHRGNTYL
jgi:hypothetical protein